LDAATYRKAIEYELLTRAIYESVLHQEGVRNVEVKHNVDLVGRSGVAHQIDVLWEFVQAGITHRVLIECKNYSSNLTLEKARNFFGVLHDIGNARGLLVTRTGFQSGVVDFCNFYGIGLKLVGQPSDEEWAGRIRKLVVNIIPRVPVSTEECPIRGELYLRPSSPDQEARLNVAVQHNPSIGATGPDTCFLDAAGHQKTEEMRWWIPRQLDVLKYEDGGPYKQVVELGDHFVSVDLGQGPELVEAIAMVIHFHVETLESEAVISDAGESVLAVLRDFATGEWEHVQTRS
tara:strand:- start:410 stop:1279 length:870 start_codon:yes stop_codon:yes gene_type:complete